MRRRILDVTAYTTLDFVGARALGADWNEETAAVVNVDIPDREDGNPEVIQLSLELDGTGLEQVPPHVDQLDLSLAQARTLADDLNDHIDSLESE